MRVGEQHAPLRQPINVRRLHLRIPAETADPIVQVINGDEQDVGAFGGGSDVDDCNAAGPNQQCGPAGAHSPAKKPKGGACEKWLHGDPITSSTHERRVP